MHTYVSICVFVRWLEIDRQLKPSKQKSDVTQLIGRACSQIVHFSVFKRKILDPPLSTRKPTFIKPT